MGHKNRENPLKYDDQTESDKTFWDSLDRWAGGREFIVLLSYCANIFAMV